MAPDRSQHPHFNKIKNIHFPKVRKITLDNNIPVYIVNGGTQDVLKLDLMVQAGALFTNKKLVAPLTGLMLNEGTTKYTSHQIAETFDFYGAYFQPIVEKDMAFMGLVSTTKHFKNTLPLFGKVVFESTFPEKELNILLERRRQKLLIDLQKTSFVARELFNERLFGKNHPYGTSNKEEFYATTTQTDLYSFYKECYTPGNSTFILSGKVTDADIELINKYLGQYEPTHKRALPKIGPEPTYADSPTVAIKQDAVQSSIRMGMLTINKSHNDYIGLKILVNILGGYFGSRLMKNIREDKGYTYGIHAMLVSLKNAGYIGIAADVKAEHTREAISEIIKEINLLCETKVLTDELNLVQNYMLGEMLQMFDGPFATSDSFKAVLQYNMGFEYFERMKNTILNITPEQLLHLADKYFDTEKLIITVAGKYE